MHHFDGGGEAHETQKRRVELFEPREEAPATLECFADQIERRVLRKEKIPHGEKVFSIFGEHTRGISKGKADRKVEIGVPVCVVEDGNRFVLGYEIMWTDGDADVSGPSSAT